MIPAAAMGGKVAVPRPGLLPAGAAGLTVGATASDQWDPARLWLKDCATRPFGCTEVILMPVPAPFGGMDVGMTIRVGRVPGGLRGVDGPMTVPGRKMM